MLLACLDIGGKAKIDAYNHYIYMHEYYVPKKSEGKWPGMSGKACSLSGMTSTMVTGMLINCEKQGSGSDHGRKLSHTSLELYAYVSIVCTLTLVSLNSTWGGK